MQGLRTSQPKVDCMSDKLLTSEMGRQAGDGRIERNLIMANSPPLYLTGIKARFVKRSTR